MAPEQAMGGAVGPCTDLYALGVLLHELLSGNVPFAASTVLGVLHRHLYEAPPPVRQLRPEVPEPLEALVLRLLAKDPKDRPSGAQEVYEALAPLLPDRSAVPVPAPMDPTRPFLRPLAPGPTAPPPPSPHPSPYRRGPRPRSGRRCPCRPADAAAVRARPRRVPHRRRGGRRRGEAPAGEGRITQAVDLLGAILPAAAAEHGEQSAVVRILRRQYATTLMDDGQYRRALPELRRLADERAAEARPRRPADPSGTGTTRPSAWSSSARPPPRSREYRALLPYHESSARQPGGDPSRAFDIRHRIGHLLLTTGEHSAAHQQFQNLLYDTERVYGPYHPLPAELRRALHHQQQVRGR